MTERERLIELIRQGMKKHEVTIEHYVIPTSDYLADYLLENGVTIPPCKVEDKCEDYPEAYYDEVGGYHECAIGWNPNGVWCGECTRISCANCPSRNSKENK